MNKNEFNDWVQDIYQKFIKDEEAVVAYRNNEKIIVLDIETDEISAYSFIESKEDFVIDPMVNIAIAYAKLRKIEIPKIEKEPTFERVGEGEKYYTVADSSLYRGFLAREYTERHMNFNELAFKSNNYFHTKERAEEVADKINFLFKLERLKDTYCPDYKPNWTDGSESKYFIYFDICTKYNFDWCVAAQNKLGVYSPTKKIAQKVCDELNKGLKMPF